MVFHTLAFRPWHLDRIPFTAPIKILDGLCYAGGRCTEISPCSTDTLNGTDLVGCSYGVIQSPGYPNQNYPNGIRHSWTIAKPAGGVFMQLTMIEYNVCMHVSKTKAIA